MEDFTPSRISTPKPISSTEAECKIDADVKMASVPETVVDSEAVAVSNTHSVKEVVLAYIFPYDGPDNCQCMAIVQAVHCTEVTTCKATSSV